nr:ORF1 [Botryosphaeria dothidea narnavirus 5]
MSSWRRETMFLVGRYRWVYSDPERAILLLKAACHHARQAAIENRKPDYSVISQLLPKRWHTVSKRSWLYQLSMVSRSLPRAPECKQDAAIKKSLDVLTSHGKAKPSRADLRSIRKFLRDHRIGPVSPEPTFNLTSTSACLACTRREGGSSADLSDRLRQVFTATELEKISQSAAPRGGSYALRAAPLWVGDAVNQRLDSIPHVDSCRAVAVHELGYKIRIVSCNDSVRTAKSERYRKPLFKRLKRLRACRLPLEGDTQTLPMAELGGKRLVYSADLSQATDHLDHEVITAFCDALNVPFSMVTGGTIEGKALVRGTLMGIPCSWPILSLVHSWAIWRLRITKGNHYLMGDDCIGLWTPAEWRRYRQGLPRLTGMPLNLSKSFEAKDSGVFCERFYRRTEVGLVEDPSVISLKVFVDRQSSEEGFPSELKIRRYLTGRVGRTRYRLLTDMQSAYAPLRRHASGTQYLPFTYGGLDGLPPKLNYEFPPYVNRVLTAIHDGDGESPIPGQLRSSVRKSSARSRLERIQAVLQDPVEQSVQYSFQKEEVPEVSALVEKFRLTTTSLLVLSKEAEMARTTSFRSMRAIERSLKKSWERVVVPRSRRLKWSYLSARNLVSRLVPVDTLLMPRGHATGRFGRKAVRTRG